MEKRPGNTGRQVTGFLAKLILAAVLLSSLAEASEPRFLRQPSNATVRMGTSRTTIQCAVANKQTDLDWVKDGFGLDTDNFHDSRYSLTGNPYIGEYHLQILNVKLSDDGEYRCQLMPDYARQIKWLQSRPAYLNVLVPPKKIILNPAVTGTISVKYPDTIPITCSTPDTKPASTITWRVGGRDYAGSVNEKVSGSEGSKLVTSSSTITLQPDKLQNGSTIECIIRHPAMDAPVSSIATLNVMYPPNAPKITEFSGKPVTTGEELTMKCTAIGGNPHATITWLIENEVIFREFQTTRTGSESILRHSVRPQDHGKAVRCRADSPALERPLEAYEMLEVYYPPEKIILNQDPEDGAPENGILTFTCYYAHSNPPASLQWSVGGKLVPQRWTEDTGVAPYLIRTIDAERFAAKTTLTLTSVRRQDANTKIACLASSPVIGYAHKVSALPKINYPPRTVDISVFYLNSPITVSPAKISPSIRDFHSSVVGATTKDIGEDVAFKAGDTVQLICTARGGNPSPDLNWFRDGAPVVTGKGKAISAAEVKVYTGAASRGAEVGEYITSTTLELTLDASYNGNTISCQAGHAGYPEKLSDREDLKVVFPPKSLTIEQFPSTPVAGRPMSLTCITSSSYPQAKISWYHNNRKIQDDWSVDLAPKNGKNHGFITSSRLQLIADSIDDGSDIVCKAEIESIRESVSQPFNVQIEYPPVFIPINERNEINATESDTYVETEALARANPGDVTYTWWRLTPALALGGNGMTLVKQPLSESDRVTFFNDRGYLRINGLTRKDGGIYQVRASNKQGSSEMNITLNVFYPASVVDVTGPERIVKEGETVELSCDFDSHPLTETKVSWVKESPGEGRFEYEIKTLPTYSVLTLANVTARDRGLYKCVVENGIGAADSAQINLQMLYAPFFDESSPSKVAVSAVADDGTLSPPAVLPCIANSRPDATFTWMKGNETIVPSRDNGYSILHDVLDFETDKSSLRVTKLTRYGGDTGKDGSVAEFTCIASNSEGRRPRNIKIVLRGPPDPPSHLSVLNVTDSAVDLVWKRGFDGGIRQTFIVRYKRSGSSKYFELKSKLNKITVSKLEPNAEYTFVVFATNAYGKSKASNSRVARTKETLQLASRNTIVGLSLSKSYIISFAVIGGIIFFLLFAVIVFAIKRCRVSKNSYKPKTIETDCDSLGQAESGLSSNSSTKKRRGSIVRDGENEETERLTTSSGNRSDAEEMRVTPTIHQDQNMVPGSDHMGLQASCYFDCGLSRCDSERTTEQFDGDRYGKSSTCSFPSIQSGIPPMPTYPQISRFNVVNQSIRSQPPVGEHQALNLPRNSSEPRFRRDVAPSGNMSDVGSGTAYIGDLYEKEALLPRPLDLPLPPSLPLYDRPQYSRRPNTRASNDALNAYCYSGTDISMESVRQGCGVRGSDQYRPYRTLQPDHSRFGQLSNDDCCCPVEGQRVYRTIGNNYRRQDACVSPTDATSCLYNIVSRPGATRNLSTSTTSVRSGGDCSVSVVGNYDQCNSPQSESTCSGLYVKSVENIADESNYDQRRPRIVNDDGSINTFGFEPIPTTTNEYRPTTLNCIRESHSQDPLPGSPSTYSKSQANRASSSSFQPRGFCSYGRSSLRGTSSTQPPTRVSFGSQKRGPTPPLRFRDEMTLALSSGSKSAGTSSYHQRPGPNADERPGRVHSDDDADSGCGGSADAVVLDSDRSPLSPNGCGMFTTRQTGLSNDQDGIQESALFV